MRSILLIEGEFAFNAKITWRAASASALISSMYQHSPASEVSPQSRKAEVYGVCAPLHRLVDRGNHP